VSTQPIDPKPKSLLNGLMKSRGPAIASAAPTQPRRSLLEYARQQKLRQPAPAVPPGGDGKAPLATAHEPRLNPEPATDSRLVPSASADNSSDCDQPQAAASEQTEHAGTNGDAARSNELVKADSAEDERQEATDHRPRELLAAEEAVNSFYPGLLPATKCGLAVVCSMAFKGRTKPIAVMFESPSGFGKSAVVQMFFPISGSDGTSVAALYTYRCDKFSPKSFVSHAANISLDKLKDVDLLPKLKNRTLVTKEMAPIFRRRDQDIQENFSTIIAVLDGKGLMTNSGTKGRRGYDGNILFNWLGATTPIPPKTHRLMSQLGTRLLFYEIPGDLPSEEALLAYAERDEASHAESACQAAVNKFIVDFFRTHKVGSVAPESIVIPRERALQLVRLALLVAHGRREIHYESEKGTWRPVSAARPEGPQKVTNYFKELARAHALIHRRTEVTAEDMELVTNLAISSIPHHLRPILRRLRSADSITSGECERLCSVSRPTARKYLTELALTGIGALEDDEEEAITLTLTLSPAFTWLKLP